MAKTLQYGGLTVAKELDDFLREEVVQGIDVDADKFLYIIDTPNITRQDLVDDYLNRV